ncbi:MAG: VWA domain-containing protein [Bradyrhizobium sp.]|uniref:VWA domain-containing protein n=1 Tax=Bradyrhizobium sp. TaxID=376 RepID=UPI003D122C7D
MSELLGDFLKALRAADVRVSSAEGIDAAAVFAEVGLADRQLLKIAWSQALAKTPDDKARFDDCFDRFFQSAGLHALEAVPSPAENDADTPGEDGRDGEGRGGQGGASLETLLTSGDRAALQLALADAARAARVSEIRLFTQRGLYARRMLDVMGLEAVEERLRRLRERGAEAEAARLRGQLDVLREEVLAYVERQIVLMTANAGTRLREEILQEIPFARAEHGDFRVMQALVRKLAKRLVALHSRRRKVADRGHLDVRHTIRRNIEFDGLLFDIVWRRRKIERPKVIAVCDVSGSVANVARFLLLFLYSVTEVLPAVRAFVFSAQLAEVTKLFESTRVEDAVATTLRRHGWGSTDYGRAFAELAALTLNDIDHRTTVLILGDARSNHGDPGHRDLRRIHARARRVIWLNPEPRAFWNTGDSEMRRLGAACDRVESCRSLKHLERIVSDLMRTTV